VPVRPAEVVNVFTARQNASHDYRQFSYNEYCLFLPGQPRHSGESDDGAAN